MTQYRGTKCLNCEHPLDVSDKYCCNCGQKNSTKRITINDFFYEFLSNFYAYDSKIKKTIISLFTKPGKGALEYIQGKKTRYANPFRFYLSVSLVYFLLIGFYDNYAEMFKSESRPLIEHNLQKDSISTAVLDTINKKFSEKKDNSENGIINFDYNPQKVTIPNNNDKIYYQKDLDRIGFWERSLKKIESVTLLRERDTTLSYHQILDTLQYEASFFNHFLIKKTIQIEELGNSKKEASEKFINYFRDKFPLILFVSLPFLTIVFYILYYRQQKTYAEHMVFTFQIMSFVFLLLLLFFVIDLVFSIRLHNWSGLILIYFTYKSLINFYQQSRPKTITKMVILAFMLSIVTVLTGLFIFVIGFLLY